jgi:hypothetical protein
MQALGEDVDLDIGPRTSNPTQQTTWELAKRGARMLSG